MPGFKPVGMCGCYKVVVIQSDTNVMYYLLLFEIKLISQEILFNLCPPLHNYVKKYKYYILDKKGLYCLLYFLQDFLLLDELETAKDKLINLSTNVLDPKLILRNGTEKEKELEKDKPKPSDLILTGVTASWQPDPIVHTLRDITLIAQPGQFIGVAGLVGSGKVNMPRNDF